jgi:hypothetical protein
MKISTHVRTRKIAVIIVIVLLGVIAIQFIPPHVSNPPVTGTLTAPPEVMEIYKRACYDCHSNETKLKWFDKIAPASWLVAGDVDEARSRFNFSNWDSLSVSAQQGIIWESINEMVERKMPLKNYTALHPEAMISLGDIEILKSYANTLSNNKPVDTAAIFNATPSNAVSSNAVLSNAIPVALDGVSYIPGYQQWQVLTTPNRFDNYTIRVLYGNDIAVKALKENNINPFPDGAAVVKIVWNKIVDKDGNVRPGTFSSAQIMTKDARRYAQTGGWGFAIFNGLRLAPGGNTASFATTCYNCHKDLAAETGYIFDVPLRNSDLPGAARLSADPSETREMFDAGNQEVIAPSMNQQQGTVSVLYGNHTARQTAVDSAGRHKEGEVYTLATWEQVNDLHWYGSNINGRLKSVERVSVVPSSTGVDIEYKLVNGAQPVDIDGHAIAPKDRISFMLNQRAAVFP